MRRLFLGTIFSALFATQMTAHDFSSATDISTLSEIDTSRRCLALAVVMAHGLQKDTVVYNFDYPSGPGAEIGALGLQHLSNMFQYHMLQVAKDLKRERGAEDPVEAVDVLASVSQQRAMYIRALAAPGAPDSEGRLALKQTTEASQHLSHDLTACISAFLVTRMDK